ncbi:uncharacterized protein LOC136040983 [Artemia franciscana]|uniref:Cuticular protein n=1 Tax=Artemia franciscana TaxID=6661 RepID=A0AA88HLB7_ARTSF|nr:hypothetical protein QYM36_009235 [Artemia franciscana]
MKILLLTALTLGLVKCEYQRLVASPSPKKSSYDPYAQGTYSISPSGYYYNYKVSDDDTGDRKDAFEQGDSKKVFGEYTIEQPDGCKRHVVYTADENGYHPTITYSGLCTNSIPKVSDEYIETQKKHLEKAKADMVQAATLYEAEIMKQKKIAAEHEKIRAAKIAELNRQQYKKMDYQSKHLQQPNINLKPINYGNDDSLLRSRYSEKNYGSTIRHATTETWKTKSGSERVPKPDETVFSSTKPTDKATDAVKNENINYQAPEIVNSRPFINSKTESDIKVLAGNKLDRNTLASTFAPKTGDASTSTISKEYEIELPSHIQFDSENPKIKQDENITFLYKSKLESLHTSTEQTQNKESVLKPTLSPESKQSFYSVPIIEKIQPTESPVQLKNDVNERNHLVNKPRYSDEVYANKQLETFTRPTTLHDDAVKGALRDISVLEGTASTQDTAKSNDMTNSNLTDPAVFDASGMDEKFSDTTTEIQFIRLNTEVEKKYSQDDIEEESVSRDGETQLHETIINHHTETSALATTETLTYTAMTPIDPVENLYGIKDHKVTSMQTPALYAKPYSSDATSVQKDEKPSTKILTGRNNIENNYYRINDVTKKPEPLFTSTTTLINEPLANDYNRDKSYLTESHNKEYIFDKSIQEETVNIVNPEEYGDGNEVTPSQNETNNTTTSYTEINEGGENLSRVSEPIEPLKFHLPTFKETKATTEFAISRKPTEVPITIYNILGQHIKDGIKHENKEPLGLKEAAKVEGDKKEGSIDSAYYEETGRPLKKTTELYDALENISNTPDFRDTSVVQQKTIQEDGVTTEYPSEIKPPEVFTAISNTSDNYKPMTNNENIPPQRMIVATLQPTDGEKTHRPSYYHDQTIKPTKKVENTTTSPVLISSNEYGNRIRMKKTNKLQSSSNLSSHLNKGTSGNSQLDGTKMTPLNKSGRKIRIKNPEQLVEVQVRNPPSTEPNKQIQMKSEQFKNHEINYKHSPGARNKLSKDLLLNIPTVKTSSFSYAYDKETNTEDPNSATHRNKEVPKTPSALKDVQKAVDYENSPPSVSHQEEIVIYFMDHEDQMKILSPKNEEAQLTSSILGDHKELFATMPVMVSSSPTYTYDKKVDAEKYNVNEPNKQEVEMAAPENEGNSSYLLHPEEMVVYFVSNQEPTNIEYNKPKSSQRPEGNIEKSFVEHSKELSQQTVPLQSKVAEEIPEHVEQKAKAEKKINQVHYETDETHELQNNVQNSLPLLIKPIRINPKKRQRLTLPEIYLKSEDKHKSPEYQEIYVDHSQMSDMELMKESSKSKSMSQHIRP